MDVSDFYDTFFEEANELLEDMERSLIELDTESPDRDQLDAIFRAAHSIKGGAATFGFQALQDTTHRMENLLDRARQGELSLDRAAIDMLLETRDLLKSQIEAYRAGSEPDASAASRICERLRELAENQSSTEASAAPTPSAPSVPDTPAEARRLAVTVTGVSGSQRDTLAEELALFGAIGDRRDDRDTLYLTLTTAEPIVDIQAVLCFVIEPDQLAIDPVIEHAEKCAETAPQPSDTSRTDSASGPGDDAAGTSDHKPDAAAGTGKPRREASSESTSIRVSTDKIDHIINLVGELVITQSMLDRAVQDRGCGDGEALVDGIGQLQRNARDLQEAVMSVRMVPMDFAFNRFPRLVRDLSGKLGKDIELETYGGATELDKGLIERIMDPMTHLVRNSLDHGIEDAETRVAAGKPAVGRLTLSARHEGAHVVIEIGDDGGGLSRERILAKAQSSGLPVSDDMSDDQVWQLIFAAGFSTAAEVSDVSGRGVGMDVVKRNIHQLGGYVDLRSASGVGTTVRIVLPLTLAIMDGMAIRAGEEVFILPLSAILESIQVGEQRVRSVNTGNRVIEVRGEYLPLVELHRAFNVTGARTRLSEGIVLVVQSDSRRFALFVDKLIGQQQIVVKNLETHFHKVAGISGATILGDGSVALILDAAALSRMPDSGRSSAPAAAAVDPTIESIEP